MEPDDYTQIDPRELRTGEPFCTLFPIAPSTRSAVEQSMRKGGYDRSKPINVWRQKNLVLDGHTRRECAIAAGIASVPVCFHDFDAEDAALAYAIANQRDRRNMTNADLLRCIEAVDKRQSAGRPDKLAPAGANFGKSAADTARIVGASPRNVERARTILDHAKEDPSIKQSVLDGMESIRMGAQKVADMKRKRRLIPPPPATLPESATAEPKPPSIVILRGPTPDPGETPPLRSKVVTHRFDDDAAVYAIVAPALKQLKADIRDALGHRSTSGMALIHSALYPLFDLPDPAHWTACGKCKGAGAAEGTCKKCRGGGYLIPGL